jgi:hypothetical protein
MSEVIDLPDRVVLGKDIHFPAYGSDSIISQVLFVTGKRGSGKSWTAAVIMEEYHRLGLQFVCFDALDAHGHIGEQLTNVVPLRPGPAETINMKELVETLRNTPKSVIISMAGMPLAKQQEMITEYCEALLEGTLGKGIMTVFEECQDFIPQMGKPNSADAIVRLCKLGRALGYGATLISQRPAGVGKEALSQASIYLVHNVINARDLKALDDQLSFGTDKKTIKRMLDGIAKAKKGEVIAYAPEFYRDRGYVVVGKIRGDRKTEHKGHNIEVKDARERFSEEVDDHRSLSSLDRPLEINKPPVSKPTFSTNVGSGVVPPSTKEILIPIEKKSEWSPEPEEPDFEYDLESSESDDSDSDVNPVVVATFVGGVILTGTLGFLVYRGLNSA